MLNACGNGGPTSLGQSASRSWGSPHALRTWRATATIEGSVSAIVPSKSNTTTLRPEGSAFRSRDASVPQMPEPSRPFFSPI